MLAGGGWWKGVCVTFVGHEVERHAEDVDLFGKKEARDRIDIVRGSAQATPDNLLAEKLRRESAQSHDVRDGLRVPTRRSLASRTCQAPALRSLA